MPSRKIDQTLSTRGPLDNLAVLTPAFGAAALLYAASRAEPGGTVFYATTFLTAVLYFAAWWIWCSRHDLPPAHFRLGHVLRGAGMGLALLALFLLGAIVLRHIPILEAPVQELLDNQRYGWAWLTALTTFFNGVGEELYFRQVVPGGQHVKPWQRWIFPLSLYVLVTASLGVPILALAAVAIGLAAHYEISESRGGLLAAITLHTVWSQGMLWILPYVLS